MLVQKVRAGLNIRFPTAPMPATLFVDRGRGFYDPQTGAITAEVRAALRERLGELARARFARS